MSKQTDFISKHKEDVIRATDGTGIFPSVKMAQMILESGWGEDAPVKLANNYFGIKKGTNWNGPTVELKTSKDAKKVNVFRKYATPIDSIKDHSSFLISNPRYAKNGVFTATTPEAQIQAIANAGYAESKNYANTIIGIINSNKLKELDKQASNKKPTKLDLKTVIVVSALIIGVFVLYTQVKNK